MWLSYRIHINSLMLYSIYYRIVEELKTEDIVDSMRNSSYHLLLLLSSVAENTNTSPAFGFTGGILLHKSSAGCFKISYASFQSIGFNFSVNIGLAWDTISCYLLQTVHVTVLHETSQGKRNIIYRIS